MLVPEYFDPKPVRDADLQPAVSVGAVQIEELAINKLTVVGTELRDAAPPEARALHPSRSRTSVEVPTATEAGRASA